MTRTIRPFAALDEDTVVRIFKEWNRAITPAGDERRFEDHIARVLAEELLATGNRRDEGTAATVPEPR